MRKHVNSYGRLGGINWLLFLSLLLLGCADTKKEAESDYTVVMNTPYISFVEEGACYIWDSIAHFVDVRTGENLPICAKPNCPHKASYFGYDSECDGYMGYGASFLFLNENHLFYLEHPEESTGATSHFGDVNLIRADKDGRNRKVIASFSGIQSVYCASYSDHWLSLGYAKTLNPDEVENAIRNQMEKYQSGIYLVNVETGETIHVKQVEEYSALFYQTYVNDKKLYYALSYQLEELDPSLLGEEEYNQAFLQSVRQELYEYDLPSQTERLIWEGNCEFVSFQNSGGYITIDDEEKTLIFKDGELLAKYPKEELANHDPSYINKFIYKDHLYMSDDQIVWCKDMETGSISSVANGKLDGRDIHSIVAEVEDMLFYSVQSDKSGYGVYCVPREDFFQGDLSKAVSVGKNED